MKPNEKRKISQMSIHQLNKRMHYLRSKQPPNAESNSNQMKHIIYHIKKIKKEGDPNVKSTQV